MVSFIIVAREKKRREEYVTQYAQEHAVDRFDITIVERDTSTKATTQSIGIDTVKLIQKKIFLKPIKSASKIVVIEDAQLLTPEAQNALLKVVEEPPANTFIILGTETKETLLATILSRCQLIELEETQKEVSKKVREELQIFIQSLPQLSLGGKLKQAEQIAKDKDKAIIWIENIILLLREEMLKNVISVNEAEYRPKFNQAYSCVTLLKPFQSLHTLLKTTNVNPRFAIEDTLLNL